MNLAPSDFPRLAGAASLSKPGFDILLAVTAAAQLASPTSRTVRERAARDSRDDHAAVRRALFAGSPIGPGGNASPTARFFDLADTGNGLPETVNSLFTRAFQPMLNPSALNSVLPDAPRAGSEDME